MIITQSQNLIDKFHTILMEHHQDVLSDTHGMGSELDVRMVYTFLYGHTPLFEYSMVELEDGKTIKFINKTLKNTPVTERYRRVSKNFSLIDTTQKIQCKAYPFGGMGIFISEMGLIHIGTYGSNIEDSRLFGVDYVKIFSDDEENIAALSDFIMENLVEVEINDKGMSTYLWVKQGYSSQLTTQTLEIKKQNINIAENYNDDLPYNEILETLGSEEMELILFDGKAGTGKTTLIEHLIGAVDKKFLYIDSNLLRETPSSSFIGFMLDHRNSIVVLEDCEKLLSKREEGNPFMGTLLNLTDGILGKTINAKFICSFNCPENKIDQALLRKGRLSLKYTFNELSLEKTQKLSPEATKPMTLAEIYHKGKKNVFNKPTEKKIGF